MAPAPLRSPPSEREGRTPSASLSERNALAHDAVAKALGEFVGDHDVDAKRKGAGLEGVSQGGALLPHAEYGKALQFGSAVAAATGSPS